MKKLGPQAPPVRKPTADKRILYVEDEDENWLVTELRLGSRYQLERAASASEACAFVRKHGSTLFAVLMDIQLKGSELDGTQLTRLFRGLPVNAPMPAYARSMPTLSCPIFFVTAFGDRFASESLQETGATDCVAKPVDFVKLTNLLAGVHTRQVMSLLKPSAPRTAAPPAPVPSAPRRHRDSVASDALGALTDAVQRGDLQATRQAVLSALEVLDASSAQLWELAPDDGLLCAQSRGSTQPDERVRVAPSSPLLTALRKGAGGVPSLSPVVYPNEAAAELSSRRLALAAPVLVDGSLKGFTAVGAPLHAAAFRAEDLRLLTTVANQYAMALERARTASSRFGRYRLGQRLGVGGMAEVFEAWQLGPGGIERKVALKRPLPSIASEPNAIEMFLDEARIISKLQHPNIAQIHEVGEVAGEYFISLEFIDGCSLQRALTAQSTLGRATPLGVVASIASHLLSALDYAHSVTDEQGGPLHIVHRDVTPANLLFTLRGELKLLDFGIARAKAQVHQTAAGVVKGTLPYISPESATSIDARADVFSAGAVLYELLTLKRAFPNGAFGGGSGGKAPVPRPASECSTHSLSSQLDGVLWRALSFDPGGRYSTASSFRDAFLAAIAVAPASNVEVARWLGELDVLQVKTLPVDAVTRHI